MAPVLGVESGLDKGNLGAQIDRHGVGPARRQFSGGGQVLRSRFVQYTRFGVVEEVRPVVTRVVRVALVELPAEIEQQTLVRGRGFTPGDGRQGQQQQDCKKVPFQLVGSFTVSTPPGKHPRRRRGKGVSVATLTPGGIGFPDTRRRKNLES